MRPTQSPGNRSAVDAKAGLRIEEMRGRDVDLDLQRLSPAPRMPACTIAKAALEVDVELA